MGWFEAARVPDGVPSPDRERSLLLYKYDACPYCQRVMRKARELGLELPVRDTMRDPAAREEMLSLTGRTQVPMMLIDGQPLFESADINAWLTAFAARKT